MAGRCVLCVDVVSLSFLHFSSLFFTATYHLPARLPSGLLPLFSFSCLVFVTHVDVQKCSLQTLRLVNWVIGVGVDSRSPHCHRGLSHDADAFAGRILAMTLGRV
jgi:hypothetical protein